MYYLTFFIAKMIINLLINFILLVFGSLFVFLPVVHLTDIPLIGSFFVEYMGIMVHIWNSFMNFFPFAQMGWNMVMYVIIPFELLMLIAKFFLGSRVPNNNY